MKKFKDIEIGVFFGLIQDRRVLIKISPTRAKNVVNCDYIDLDENCSIIVLF